MKVVLTTSVYHSPFKKKSVICIDIMWNLDYNFFKFSAEISYEYILTSYFGISYFIYCACICID